MSPLIKHLLTIINKKSDILDYKMQLKSKKSVQNQKNLIKIKNI